WSGRPNVAYLINLCNPCPGPARPRKTLSPCSAHLVPVAAAAAAAAAMRFLSGASASRLPSPLLSHPRARTRCVPASFFACRAASSSAAGAGDGGSRKPWLFVGLGNPGKVYQGTRHNVGFEMIDVISEAEGISLSSMQFKAMVGKGKSRIGDAPVMLAKPQTFMNASGESVGQLVSYFKIPLNQVVVIYDDLDLPFAKLRLLPKGGHGGHNGYPISHLLSDIIADNWSIVSTSFKRRIFEQVKP
ncbi:hypothetical protein U9M48_018016, partial [Paspalum notatum var. saurae]